VDLRTALRLALPLTVLIVFALATPAAAPARTAAQPQDYAPGEVIVGLREGPVSAESKRLARDAGARVARVSSGGDFATLSVPPGSEAETIAQLLADPAVESAELNAVKQPQRIPVDEFYPRQWSMEMIGAPEAWSESLGAGVTVAVLDTGVAFENYAEFGRSPELSQTFFVYPYDVTDGSPHPNDENGHGTHVTGTLAQDWDAYGAAGLVPEAAIMPVRVCQAHGCNADIIANGVRWAVDHGADVINMSLGGPLVTNIERDAFEYAEENGVVIVAAGGNGGGDLVGDNKLDYPARLETVISVGSVNRLMGRAVYSSYGPHEGEDGVHVMAPGGNRHEDLDGDGFDDGILQNTYAFTCSDEERDYTKFKLCSYYGTSMATAHVSGIAAMLLSLHPELTPAEVRAVMRCGAIDLGSPGYDNEYGAGLSYAPAVLGDWDENGIVDCLDPPPPFSASMPQVKVRPGQTVNVPLDVTTPWPGVSSYELLVSFDDGIIAAVGCTPRQETECTITGGKVRVAGAFEKALSGTFRPAYIEFQAVGALNGYTSLHLDIGAESARVPDIGLQLLRKDGSVRISDPGPTLAGDLDCSGAVDGSDVILVLRAAAAASPPPFCADQGDVNCSGGLDAFDGLAIVAFMAEIAQPQIADCPAIGSSLVPELPVDVPAPAEDPPGDPTE